MNSTKPYFSIVIPVLNEEKYIPNLMHDLWKQSHTHFEIIIVDGNSEDKTITKIKQYEKRLPIHILSTSIRNVSVQRNLGAKKARGKWVLFMDADIRIASYFLIGLQYQIEKHPTVDLFTTWMKAESKTPEHLAVINMMNMGLEMLKKVKPYSQGDLICCKKNVLTKVQFNEDQYYSEDISFVQDAVKHGYQFDVFREPRRTVSFRRFKKEGTLKLSSTFAINQIKYLQGNTFKTPPKNYPMHEGGKYYEKEKHPPKILQYVEQRLLHAHRSQLAKMRQLLQHMMSSEE